MGRSRLTVAPLLVLSILAALLPAAAGSGKHDKRLLEFALEMAKKGNWREARFRWEQVHRQQPDNPFLINNLAVAMEALGDSAAASELYAEAVDLSRRNYHITQNARRHELFLDAQRRSGQDEPQPRNLSYSLPDRKKGGKGPKPIEVEVGLPIEPRLDLNGYASILVASFIVPDSDLFDINAEVVRYLRSEFRRNTAMQILDVTPAPAVPEQRIEDLMHNDEFWRHLSRKHDADLIVSGTARLSRRDISGWRTVDFVSATTGQKVRRTRFEEMEEFSYDLDVIYLDGKSGELLLHDRVSRTVSFPGAANDPLTAFYKIGEIIQNDILSAVTPRVRQDLRVVFRG